MSLPWVINRLSGHLRLLHRIVVALVLADKLGRSLLGLADLQKWVLVVLTSSFAFLAVVSIRTDRAHVADTNDGVHVATVTDDTLVNGLVLLIRLLLKILGEHLLELRVAVLLNFLSDDGGDSRELS